MKRLILLLTIASCSGNYHHQRAYIISQSPSEEHLEENWEVILDCPEEELQIEEK